MAAYILAMFNEPNDPDAFDQHYTKTHIPLGKKMPGLRSMEISSGGVHAPDGSQPFYLIAKIEFDSMQAIQEALNSPEGQAAANDLPNFASGGVSLVMFETKPV
jgi:uncharacterized protein (TIGR02118 family)